MEEGSEVEAMEDVAYSLAFSGLLIYLFIYSFHLSVWYSGLHTRFHLYETST